MCALYIHTPVIRSIPMSERTGKNIQLKLENLQPSGSFKMRGISLMCQHLLSNGQQQLISSSGGNAGYTAAYTGHMLGVPATIFVPETTNEHVVQMMRKVGADVRKHGRFWEEAHTAALAFARENHAEVIHPFDNPVVWQGHATMIDEVVKQTSKPDAILLTVGGGGLMAGVAMGLKRHGWTDVDIIAIETLGADSLSQAIKAGHAVRLEAITSSVKTLGANQVCDEAFRVTKEFDVHSVVVTDAEAIQACKVFMEDHRMLVEPACGAALSVLNNHHPVLDNYSNIMVMVCGGISFSVKDVV
ncbi:MAG: pyridoxal-phosphate dependent enzyme [Bacteroidetes bacterium]|nr:pyridoxal-phosphate dependent enzyme [Bacteroidota bacterium]